jgi:hypothetical protein
MDSFQVKFLVLTFVMLFLPSTNTEVKSGTVIVTGFSNKKIVLAADSRQDHMNCTYNDIGCNITTLIDKFIFIAYGLISYRNVATQQVYWNAAREAKTVFRDPGLADIDALASRWGDLIAGYVATFMSPMEFSTYQDRRIVMGGSFIGLTKTGDIHIAHENIRFLKNPNSIGFRSEAVQITLPDNLKYSAIAEPEIVDEFKAQTTSRSHDWKREIDAARNKARPEDADAMEAIGLVNLTILYSKSRIAHSDAIPLLGGLIDAVELESGSTLRWVQRKDGCKE